MFGRQCAGNRTEQGCHFCGWRVFFRKEPPTSIKLEETPGERIDLRIWGQSAVPYTPDDMHFLFPTWQKSIEFYKKKWRWLSIWSRSDLVLWDQSVKGILSNRHSKNVQSNEEVYTDTHSHACFFSVFIVWHILTHCAHSQHCYCSSSDCQDHSIKSSLLTCLTWVRRKLHPRLNNPVTIFLSLSHSFACQLRDVWRNDYSRVQCRLWAQQWDWYDRKVFSDILLQLPSWKCCI